MSQIRV